MASCMGSYSGEGVMYVTDSSCVPLTLVVHNPQRTDPYVHRARRCLCLYDAQQLSLLSEEHDGKNPKKKKKNEGNLENL